VQESPEKNSFSVTAAQNADNLVNICASYVGSKEETDMVVIELELLSGFAAKESSLEALKKIEPEAAPVKKYEYDQKEGTIVLYFDKMPKEENCWAVAVKETAKVGKLKPALVKIYDYYNQEDVFSTSYNVVQ
jgi:hypothetical protein